MGSKTSSEVHPALIRALVQDLEAAEQGTLALPQTQAQLTSLVSKAYPDLREVNEIASTIARDSAAGMIANLTAEQTRKVRGLVSRAIDLGWDDATLAERVAKTVGLDLRYTMAVENFAMRTTGAGTTPLPKGILNKQVKAYKDRLRMARALRIAKTEVHAALSQAQRMLWFQQQQDGDLSPYAVRISKRRDVVSRCPVCTPENGRRRSLHNTTGGPPYHPNCKCYEDVLDEGTTMEKALVSKGAGKCKYCAAPATKKILHSEGMAYVQTCAKHLARGKNDAMHSTPDGTRDASNINSVKDIEKAVSPGGRPADDSPLGTPGGKKNWVDRAGGLPKYIRMVAHALIRSGKSKSRAIGMAVGIVRNWAEGKGNVSPKVRAAAVKAIAEWEAKRAGSHVSKGAVTTWNLDDYHAIHEQLKAERIIP